MNQQFVSSTEQRWRAISNTQAGPASVKKVRRAVVRSVERIRASEIELFEEDSNSPLALRLAVVRTELSRVLVGLPVRVDALLRALGDFSNAVPIREPKATEVLAAQ